MNHSDLTERNQNGFSSKFQIFVSYRRADSADVTGRIYDRLTAHFGRLAVFKDVDSIPLGVDFKEHLTNMVNQCTVFLAVIGNTWLEPVGSGTENRLHDPGDFVRLEIEAALQKKIPIIPVLIHGASMPVEGQLPQSLRPLIYRNGIPIRSDPDFHRDMDRLIAALSGMQREEARQVRKSPEPDEQAGRLNLPGEGRDARTPVPQEVKPLASRVDESGTASQQALMLLGWAFAGILGGNLYDSLNEEFAGAVSGAVGGAIGGIVTAFASRNGSTHGGSRRFWTPLAWAIGLAIGWHLGDRILTETTGVAIGFAIGSMISLAILLAFGLLPGHWKRLSWTVIAWAIGGGLGWFLAKRVMIERLDLEWATSWATGMGIGWTIAGLVMGWQLMHKQDR